jgi:hypothetical protein
MPCVELKKFFKHVTTWMQTVVTQQHIELKLDVWMHTLHVYLIN